MTAEAGMNPSIAFTDFSSWNALAAVSLSHPLGPAKIPITSEPGYLVVEPAIAVHEDIAVLSSDWLPVHRNGVSTYERMIHSPGLYLPKAQSVRVQDGAYVSTSTAAVEAECPLVLVGGSSNYYHWLADYLPRLLVADMFPAYADWKFLLNKPLAPFQQEALELLGIDETKRFCVERDVTVHAPRMLVPTLLSNTTMVHPEAIAMVREAFPPVNVKRRRVYLSRNDASWRRLINEEALMELLAQYGFETFVPGTMGFQEQIDLCAGAEAVVALHGAGMANLMFCEPSTEVFEISYPTGRVTSMQIIALYGRLNHRFIDATIPGPHRMGKPLLVDWQVDLDVMRAALETVF